MAKDKKSEVVKGSRGGSMGVTSKGAMVKEPKEKIAKVSQPGYNNKNQILPDDKGTKVKGTVDMSMFSKDALGSEIDTSGKYAAKSSQKAKVDKNVFSHKDNEIWPDANY